MPSERWAITVTPELAAAVDALVAQRGDSRSNLVETLLRENPYVQRAVEAWRREQGPPAAGPGASEPPEEPTREGATVSAEARLKRGRDPEKLKAVGETARRAWERAQASGRVRLLDR